MMNYNQAGSAIQQENQSPTACNTSVGTYGLQLLYHGQDFIKLGWNHKAGVDEYDIWNNYIQQVTGDHSDTIIFDDTQMPGDGVGINFGIRYQCYPSTYSDWEFLNSQVPRCVDQPDPTGFSLLSRTSTSITVQWADPTPVPSWVLGVEVYNNFNFVGLFIPLGVEQFSISGLNPSTSYNFAVRTRCLKGQGDWTWLTLSTLP
jgi:hypothetical protein